MKAINTLRLPPVILLTLCFNFRTHGQARATRERYWTGGYNFSFFGVSPSRGGSRSGTNFHRTVVAGSALDWQNLSDVWATTNHFGLNGGFMWKNKSGKSYTSVVGEMEYIKNSYAFKHPYKVKIELPPQDNDADDTIPIKTPAKVIEFDKSFRYSLSVQHFWYNESYSVLRGESYHYIKASFGQSFYHRDANGMIGLSNTQEIKDADGNTLQTTVVNYNPKSYVAGVEIGTRAFSPSKDRALDIGIAWYLPFNSSYTKQFEFYKTTPAASASLAPTVSLVSSSKQTFGLGSVFLNVSYSFNSKMKIKERDTTSVRKKAEKHDIVHNRVTNGRNVTVQDQVETGGADLTIKIWDNGLIDGDRVSLFLNDKEILHDHKLKKHKKPVTLHLEPGVNYLVLHALNLGSIAPNTAAIEIDDGYQGKTITLRSDMKKSGAIEIIYNP